MRLHAYFLQDPTLRLRCNMQGTFDNSMTPYSDIDW